MKGALYVEGAGEESCSVTESSEECGEQYLYVDTSTFKANEAGYTYRYDISHDSASALYIKNIREVMLEDTEFVEHNKTNFYEHVTTNVNLFEEAFPAGYFNYSHSPVVRIKQQDLTGFSTSESHLQYTTTLQNCLFRSNANFQLLGLGEHTYYHGSLLHYDEQSSNNPIDSWLKLNGIAVSLNKALGP